jgi:putative Holliday junction resolvase
MTEIRALPTEGRILGVDLGDVRIGLAVSDPLQMLASPHETIPAGQVNENVEAVIQRAENLDVVAIVVGLPLNKQGEAGPVAEKSLRFAAALRRQYGRPVFTQDERFTTSIALRALRAEGVRGKAQRKAVDARAAANLLQTFLDRLRHERTRSTADEHRRTE